MDAGTVAIYEQGATRWAAARPARLRQEAVELAGSVTAGELRADLGCGPGKYTGDLGTPVVAFDAALSMLTLVRGSAPQAWPVQGDLEHLPFRAGALAAGWARASYLHLPRRRLPLALADLHRATVVGAPVAVTMKRGDYEGNALPGDDFPGRFFACWEPEPLVEVFEGAGFAVTACRVTDEWTHLSVTRARTLPDYVGPGLRAVVCGLNPSLHAADAGVGYAGPGNRFWPAALAAGLVTHDRDPRAAVRVDGVGMTDFVKRATVGAKELTTAEYRAGATRVERIVAWLRPRAICFVGLAGYRAAVDRRAQPGLQPEAFGGVPAYVMPSTSGLNAATSLADLTDHVRNVVALTA